MQLSRAAKIYITSVVGLGLVIGAFCVWRYPIGGDLIFWLLFASLLILALLSTRFGLTLRPHSRVHVDSMVFFTGLLVFNPAAAVIIAFISSLLGWLRHGLPLLEILFNLGQRLIYVGGSALLLNWLTPTPWRPVDVQAWLGLALAAGFMDLANAALVSGIVSLQTRRPLPGLIVETLRWSFVLFIVTSTFALFTALVVQVYPWALVMLGLVGVLIYNALERTAHQQSEQKSVADQNSDLAKQLGLQAQKFQELVVEMEKEIAERREAEAAFTQSESRYRRLFEDSPISLWVEDFSELKKAIDELKAEGVTDFRAYFSSRPENVFELFKLLKYYDVNQTTLRLYKAQSKEELLNNAVWMFAQEALPGLIDELVAIAEGKTEFVGEVASLDLEGNLLLIRVHWSLLSGLEDPWSSVIVSIIDITTQKRAEQALRRRADELAVLHAVATAGAEATQEEALIERVTQVIGESLYPDQFGVMLLDPSGSFLTSHPSYRGGTAEEKQIQVPIGAGNVGLVATSGRSVRVDDTAHDGRYLKSGLVEMRSELCVPLKVGDQILGVINAESQRLQAFTEADEHLLGILAGQLGTAIDRLRAEAAEREKAMQLAAIYDVSQEIIGASLDPEKVYLAIHQAVGKLMPSEAFVITLYDPIKQENEAVYLVDRGGRFPSTRVPADQGLSGQVVRSGEPLIIDDFDEFDANQGALHFGEKESVRSILVVPMRTGGRIIGILSTQSYQPYAYTSADLHLLELLTAYAAIALGNARLYEETLRRADELAVLVKVSAELRLVSTRLGILPVILQQVCDLLKTAHAGLLMHKPATKETFVELGYGNCKDLIGQRVKTENTSLGQVMDTGQPEVNLSALDLPEELRTSSPGSLLTSAFIPLLAPTQTLGVLWVELDTPFSQEAIHLLTTIADIAANAIYRSTLVEQAQQHAEQMATVSAVGRALSEILDLPEILVRLTEAVQELLPDVSTILLSLMKPGDELPGYVYGVRDGKHLEAYDLGAAEQNNGSNALIEAVLSQRPVFVHQDGARPLADRGKAPSSLYVPMIVKGEILGVIEVHSRESQRFQAEEAELLTLVGNTAAIAIENARLFAETEQRLRRLAALRAMDMAISSSFDLRVTLNVLLDQLMTQLKVDAASVLLFNSYSQSLDYITGRGFNGTALEHVQLRLGEDLPGRAALERRLVTTADFPGYTFRSRRLLDEDFVDYYGMPLVAKGQLKGVLEIFNRSPITPDPEWIDFLETLAGDTAIAIDNSTLFSELQRSNNELVMAYDTTLEGWSRMLDLRNRDDEGHVQRLIELTLDLGRLMGIGQNDLVHLRRGVLLHDIGEMGIPDAILKKPSSLTEEEWQVIRMHPVYAFEVLSPISYLRQALDIPYCHHERWDGSGYPRGLQGARIPLAARIFAVADVWEALRSDRPYRKAWPEQQALEYLRSQAGKQFDPEVVRIFLHYIEESEGLIPFSTLNPPSLQQPG